MRKEQVRKNPRETLLTPKQDDNTSKSLELSEGQLEAQRTESCSLKQSKIRRSRVQFVPIIVLRVEPSDQELEKILHIDVTGLPAKSLIFPMTLE